MRILITQEPGARSREAATRRLHRRPAADHFLQFRRRRQVAAAAAPLRLRRHRLLAGRQGGPGGDLRLARQLRDPEFLSGLHSAAMDRHDRQDGAGGIPYADLPARLGIACETWPGGVRITIPPARLQPVEVSLVLLFGPVLLLAYVWNGAPLLWIEHIRRRFRPTIIEVTDAAVTLLNMTCVGEAQDLVRPRASVYEVKYVSHSGTLFIKAVGHEMIECRPVRQPEALEWIAALLREALGMRENTR